MTPITDPQTRPQRKYNVAQKRRQTTVERIFVPWKRMFLCLSTTLRTKFQTSLTIIVALPVLYYIIRSRNYPIDEPGNVPANEEEVDDIQTDEQRL